MSRAVRSYPRLVLVLPLLLSLSLCACGGGSAGASGEQKKQTVKGFRVTEVEPPDGALAVPVSSVIRVTFSGSLDRTSISKETVQLEVRATGQSVRADLEISGSNDVVEITPAADLLLNTKYRVRVQSAVLSSIGVPLAENFESFFTTAVTPGSPPTPPPPAPLGRIVYVANMNLGRSSHTSTLMDNGKVLITGGFVNTVAVTNTAEVYDGTNFTFTYTPSNMVTSRAFHTATLLEDGKVLILGGVTGPNLTETNSAELYDPVTQQFDLLNPGMLYPRAFHAATLLEDGRVLITGGTVPTTGGVYSSKKAEIFDPVTRKFGETPEMAAYRAGHTATLLDDGRVLVLGGNSTDVTIELFDTVENDFIPSDQKLRYARRGHTATFLPATGNVIVAGGGHKSAGIWVAKDSTYQFTVGIPIEERKDHTANVTKSGRILFTGGSRQEGSLLLFSQTSEYYDRFSGAFLGSAPTLVNPTTRHRATTLKSGNILITGGENTDPSQPELKSAMVYTEESE